MAVLWHVVHDYMFDFQMIEYLRRVYNQFSEVNVVPFLHTFGPARHPIRRPIGTAHYIQHCFVFPRLPKESIGAPNKISKLIINRQTALDLRIKKNQQTQQHNAAKEAEKNRCNLYCSHVNLSYVKC